MAEPPASIRWHTSLEKPAKLQRSLWDSQKAVSYAGSVDHVAADPVGRVVAHSDRTLTAACACARNVELGNATGPNTQEAVPHATGVDVSSRRIPACVDVKR